MARKKNYRKNKSSKGFFALILGVIVVVGLIFGLITYSNNSTENKVSLSASNFCSDNPTKTLKLREKDMLSSTGGYINGSTVYIKNLDTGSVVEATLSGGTGGSFTSVATDLNCKSEKGYEIYVKGSGEYSSDGKLVLTPAELSESRTTLERTIEGTAYSPFKVKVRDDDANADAYTSTNSTDYVSSTLTSTFYSGTGSTGWTVGTDGYLDLQFTFAPNVSAETKGKGMYIALNTEDDSNINDWDEDSIKIVWDGVTLSEADLPSNDLKALSAYEKVYYVENPIGMKDGVKDSVTKVDFYIQSDDGINPDFDPVIKIVALGDYKSTTSDDVLVNVGFQDDSSRTELYSAQTITLSVD